MTRQATTADLGRIVRYYLNGWRFGRLAKIEGQTATLQPPRDGARAVHVPLADVESMPEARPVETPTQAGFVFGFEV